MTESQANYILYGTTACHLCELAEELILALDETPDYEKVDIANSDELFERYGIRIPVLRHREGDELGWPFSANDLLEFIHR